VRAALAYDAVNTLSEAFRTFRLSHCVFIRRLLVKYRPNALSDNAAEFLQFRHSIVYEDETSEETKSSASEQTSKLLD